MDIAWETTRKSHVCNRAADGKKQRLAGESSNLLEIRKSNQNDNIYEYKI
jgi:hypothetical protein